MSSMVKVFREFAEKNKRKIYLTKKRKLTGYGFLRYLLITALLQVIVVEAIQRGSIISPFIWTSTNLLSFIINFFLIVIFSLIFILLTGSLGIALSSSSFVLVFLSLANMVKKQLLGDPLFPWDFSRLDQIINLIPEYKSECALALVCLGVLLIIAFFIVRFLLPQFKIRWSGRVIVLIILLITVPLAIFYRHTPIKDALKNKGIENIYLQQTENSLTNGFVLGFVMNIENTMVLQPVGYNSTAIKQIMNKNSSNTYAGTAQTNSEQKTKPNIIVILNESFWDPTVLPNVTFSEYPLPYFRELWARYNTTKMISPVFGGSTANVEFELLTGLSTNFLQQGAIVYQQYLEKPLPALPSLLKSQGYSTIAIHPYHDWFYKRNKVYPLMGFESFLSLNDFKNAPITGQYIGDFEVSKKIIEQLGNSDKPKFIFAVTMQNHGPYTANRYSSKTLTVSGSLSSEGKAILETYAQGVNDADKALKYLIDNITKSNKPTLIVFFGDHLPYLGKDYKVYKETGFIQGNDNDWTLDERLKMKSVPLLIWSNYGSSTSNDVDNISPSFLGSYLLKRANLKGNYVFNFDYNLSQKLPVFSKTAVIDSKKNISGKLPDDLQKEKDDYWLIEYDLLFGKQYYANMNN